MAPFGDADTLLVSGHLDVLSHWLFDGEVELVDADGVTRGSLTTDSAWLDDGDVEVMDGPRNWLTPYLGAMATYSVDDMVLRIAPASTAPAVSDRQRDAVKAAFDQLHADALVRYADDPDPFVPVEFAPVLVCALALDRDAFLDGPNPLQQDLFDAAGLRQYAGRLVPDDFDAMGYEVDMRRRRVADRYGLDQDKADGVLLIDSICRLGDTDREVPLGEITELADVIADLLDDATVTRAVLEEVADGIDPAAVFRVADGVRGHTGAIERPGVAALWAWAADATDNAPDAADLVDEALRLHPDFGPLLMLAAGYASDQGDAKQALSYLRRAGADAGLSERLREITAAGLDPMAYMSADQHLMAECLEWSSTRSRPAANRNDPCPCGSGRKYKACHLGKDDLPLSERCAWLNHKARRFLRSHAGDLLEEVAEMLAISGESVREMMASDVVIDIALHEGGVMERFLASRSSLLPADEALLARQWTLVDRSLFEVVPGGRRDTLRLRDVRTGEEVTATNVITPPTSGLVIARPLPVLDEYRLFGSIVKVRESARMRVIELLDSEPDAVALAEGIAMLFAPPTISATDGDEMVLHSLTWSVPDVSVAVDALRAAGLEENVAGGELNLLSDSGAGATVLASVMVNGAVLEGMTNTDARAARLRDLVAEHVPGSRLVADIVTSAADMLAAAARRRDGVDDDDDFLVDDAGLDADGAAFVADYILDYERQWLDMEIPALRGRTPREAVGDPVGREEVEQLLASMPTPPPGSVGMDPSRIRRALGL